MKLKAINSGRTPNTIFGESVRLAPTQSVSYLFVETVIDSGLLSEASGSRLGALIGASLAKLQNFLTPGATTDLIALLSFIAPEGGGLPKIKELITRAKESESPLYENDGWWTELFAACGVKDPAVQDGVRSKVKKELEPAKEEPPTPAPESKPSGGLENPFATFMPQQPKYRDPIDKMLHDRQVKSNRMRDLNNRLKSISSRYHIDDLAEGVFNDIAIGVLEENYVRSNLKFVANNLLRRFTAENHGTNDDSNWFKKFMTGFSRKSATVDEGFNDFMRGARHFLTNPEYSKDKLDQKKSGEDNQRGAKLAVQLLFDYLKQELSARLRVAGLSMDDLHNTLKLWNSLHSRYSKGNKDPRLMAKLQEVYNEKLKPLVLAIRPDLGRGMYEHLSKLGRIISEELYPYSPDYVNPDTLSRRKAIPFFYYNGNLYLGQEGQVHGEVIPQLTEVMPDAYGQAHKALNGRVGEYGGNWNKYVSFWNESQSIYTAELRDCLHQLTQKGLIDSDTLVSTPVHGTVKIDEIAGNQGRTLSPDEEEKQRLQKELHTMTGAAKRDAMNKVGVGGGGKPHAMQTAMDKAGLRQAGQKWWAPNSESIKPVSSINEEEFFSYVELAKGMWREKVQEAQKKFNISFDLENDYDVHHREIIIDQTQWDHTKCKFKCELYSAGGDWQCPVLYFRCQIVDGYAKDLSTYGNSHFIYIPGKDEGNPHLEKVKDGWSAPDSDCKEEGNEKQAWESLKKYLKKLVDDEIAEVKKDSD